MIITVVIPRSPTTAFTSSLTTGLTRSRIPAAGFGLLRCSGVCFIAQDSEAVTRVDTTMCATEVYQILPLTG